MSVIEHPLKIPAAGTMRVGRVTVVMNPRFV